MWPTGGFAATAVEANRILIKINKQYQHFNKTSFTNNENNKENLKSNSTAKQIIKSSTHKTVWEVGGKRVNV